MIDQEAIFYIVRMDFIRELPEDFDKNKFDLVRANDIIIKFMEKHG